MANPNTDDPSDTHYIANNLINFKNNYNFLHPVKQNLFIINTK